MHQVPSRPGLGGRHKGPRLHQELRLQAEVRRGTLLRRADQPVQALWLRQLSVRGGSVPVRAVRRWADHEDQEELVQPGHIHYDPMEEDDGSWKWVRHLEKYAAPKFQEYLPENVIERVMGYCPLASNNFLQLPVIDENLQRVMDKKMAPQLAAKIRAYDRDMATIQAKTLRIAAPLGSLYAQLDAVIRGEGGVSLSLPEVMTLVEKTILLTGQANNACLYS